MKPQASGTFYDHFSGHAAAYAAHRPVYPVELARYLAGLAPDRSCAWDCGCGSGQMSVLLADEFDRVVATDAAAAQIAHARAHPRVEYRCAPAEASGLPAKSVDLIVAAQAAHWFDLPAFFQEVRRVGRPEAVVALITDGLMIVDPCIDPTVQDFYANALRGFWPPERRMVDDGYRTIAFPFKEIVQPELEVAPVGGAAMVQDRGTSTNTAGPPFSMSVAWNLSDLIGYVETWSAVRALLWAASAQDSEHAEPNPFNTFCRTLTDAWGPPRQTRTVRWPLSLRVGRL